MRFLSAVSRRSARPSSTTLPRRTFTTMRDPRAAVRYQSLPFTR